MFLVGMIVETDNGKAEISSVNNNNKSCYVIYKEKHGYNKHVYKHRIYFNQINLTKNLFLQAWKLLNKDCTYCRHFKNNRCLISSITEPCKYFGLKI